MKLCGWLSILLLPYIVTSFVTPRLSKRHGILNAKKQPKRKDVDTDFEIKPEPEQLKNAEPALPLETRAKLKEELSSPFRKLRQFVFISMGAGGGLATLTALPQLLFAIQEGGDKILPAATNFAVDVGAVIAGITFWIKELSNEKAKQQIFLEKEKQVSNELTTVEREDREKRIGLLPVEIQVSEKNENATRIVRFSDLQERGRQHIIIVAGKQAFVKDAVLSARIEGADLFNSQDTVIVPVVLEDEQLAQLDEGRKKGFGTKELLMEAPYIAKPAQVLLHILPT